LLRKDRSILRIQNLKSKIKIHPSLAVLEGRFALGLHHPLRHSQVDGLTLLVMRSLSLTTIPFSMAAGSASTDWPTGVLVMVLESSRFRTPGIRLERISNSRTGGAQQPKGVSARPRAYQN
tara:strand:+ start:375 stop:737 length:363 start_codon:yes stop_codon:yes gene_type:complete